MPIDELCSPCYISLHQMMQASPYSIYHDSFQSDYLKARLEYIYTQCDVDKGASDVKDPQYILIEEEPIPCFTDITYTSRVSCVAERKYRPDHQLHLSERR
jgi:hypothetical protein